MERARELNYHSIRIMETVDPLPDRCLILRHDIEYCIDCALHMARAEHKVGLRSSYFVLLHSVFYNPFTPPNTDKLLAIADMGHEIGLHYETYYYENLGRSPLEGICDDAEYLQKALKIEIRSISQHRPARSSVVEELKKRYIDAYSASLIYDMYYISDSGCKWRKDSLYDSLGKVDQIHALIHPDYWTFDENMNLPDIYQALVRKNVQSISGEAEVLIRDNYNYLLRREQMDTSRRKKYSKK